MPAEGTYTSLFQKFVNYGRSFYIALTMGPVHKKFYGRNLQILIVSGKSFQPSLMFTGKADLPEWSSFQILQSRVGSWFYPQTLD
jgi:hypothetical protein